MDQNKIMSNQEERLLDAKETIRRLKISRGTLYTLMERGLLTPIGEKKSYLRKRGKLEFRESEVQRLVESDSQDDESGPASRVSDRVA